MEQPPPGDLHELVLQREIDAPVQALWRCWTEPALLAQWFCPRPWQVTDAELDVRTGGAQSVTMRSPEGLEHVQRGVYLEVNPERRLVFTDAYTEAWRPSGKPFFTVIVDFEDLGLGRTRYHAQVRHWSAEDKAAHAAMGFEQGWGTATDQLAALARTL